MSDEKNNTPSFDGPTVVRPTKEDSPANSLPQGGLTDHKSVEKGPDNTLTPDRTGPGTGDGLDSRPLGDPNAPQGTSRDEVPGGNIPAAPADRPAPAGEVRTSWAEQGHTNS